MAESRRIRLRRSLDGLLRPYSGSPPPGLYRPETSDVLIRLAGTAVPHFLSVVMRLGGDREPPELPAAVNRRTARVVGRRRVARDPDVIELTLADPDRGGPGWHPGAHIDLHLPSGRMRQYSLCGDPDRRHECRIAIRRIPTGSGGSVEAQNLSIGQAVEISDPRNAFMMPLPGAGSSSERLRFIAGGIGITPILPMVRLAERRGVPWSLCYTGRHRDSLPFLDEVLALGDKVSVRTDDEHGLPTAAELLGGLAARTAVYACGPPPMLDLVRAAVPADSSHELHVERFSPRPVVEGRPFEIQLARSAEVVQVGADQSALSALRAARPDLSYSCQQGFCGTCVQRVVAGEVEHRDTLLTDGQRELGQMLVCVSRAHADGARLILDL